MVNFERNRSCGQVFVVVERVMHMEEGVLAMAISLRVKTELLTSYTKNPQNTLNTNTNKTANSAPLTPICCSWDLRRLLSRSSLPPRLLRMQTQAKRPSICIFCAFASKPRHPIPRIQVANWKSLNRQRKPLVDPGTRTGTWRPLLVQDDKVNQLSPS